MKAARILLRIAGGLVLLAVLGVVGFLLAAAAGAVLPRSDVAQVNGKQEDFSGGEVTIYLLSGLLHTDIVVPANELVLERFPQLRETRLPMDHPALENLAFGWGSRAFYTTAGSYSDIRFSTAWRAATGDTSVMRVVAMPILQAQENIREIHLNQNAFERLLEAIAAGFRRSASGDTIYLPQHSIGGADVFFAGEGDFNLVYPCNRWTADALARAGIATGRWTPTTYSLLWSIDWHN